MFFVLRRWSWLVAIAIALAACQTTGTDQTAKSAASAPGLSYPDGAYPITSGYGSWRGINKSFKRPGPHPGVDISAPTGTPVYATEFGKVTFVGLDPGNYMGRCGTSIRFVTTRAGTLHVAHCHLASTLVEQGDYVKAGQKIGTVGSSGSTNIPHLHFEVRNRDFEVLDPTGYLFGSNGLAECVDPSQEYTPGRAHYAKQEGRPVFLYPVACTN